MSKPTETVESILYVALQHLLQGSTYLLEELS
uniref:Uncharacterized protein n=1 Tax=Arcella intermedia TaxID=1963864 RepID=A0A6B2LX58_9EUKA